MSKILARFKRAASEDQGSPRERQLSFDEYINGPGYVSGSGTTSEDETILSPNSTLGPSVTRSPVRTTYAGSHFVEEIGGGRAPSLSPLSRTAGGSETPVSGPAGSLSGVLTPSPSKRSALDLPDSTAKPHSPAYGTPKLVLTDPDTNSPRSFSSSPGKSTVGSGQRPEGLGLGLGSDQGQSEAVYDSSIVSSVFPVSFPVTAHRVIPYQRVCPESLVADHSGFIFNHIRRAYPTTERTLSWAATATV